MSKCCAFAKQENMNDNTIFTDDLFSLYPCVVSIYECIELKSIFASMRMNKEFNREIHAYIPVFLFMYNYGSSN